MASGLNVEKTKGVGGIVEGDLVKQNARLVWSAPAHVKTAADVRSRLDPGRS